MNSCIPTSFNSGRRRSLLLLLTTLMLVACGPKTVEPQPQQVDSAEAPPAVVEPEHKSTAQKLKFERGLSALSSRDYARARRIFGEIIKAEPGLSGPYANLALIDFKQAKYSQASKQVNRAIELNPLQSQAYHLRAQIQLKQGEIKKARDDYRRAIELNPKYLNAHYNLALLYDIYLQEIALAIDHYEIYQSLLVKKDDIVEEWINHLRGTLNNG